MRIWIGKRESDINYSLWFDGSITYYGTNRNGNRCFVKNNETVSPYKSKDFTNFVKINVEEYYRNDRSVEFYFYNQTFSYRLDVSSSIRRNFRCINNLELLAWLNNKTFCRLWASNYIAVPFGTLVTPEECTYEQIHKLLPAYQDYIVQSNSSSGGYGTHVFTPNNASSIAGKLVQKTLYLVAPYYEKSKSCNIHVIITPARIILLPISTQFITRENDNLLYMGSSFEKSIDCMVIQEIKTNAYVLAKILQDNGYRGICGIDYLLTEEGIKFLEINPRYQGSSVLVDKTLHTMGLPSLFQYNLWTFSNDFHQEYEVLDSLEISNSLVSIEAGLHVEPGTFFMQHSPEELLLDGYGSLRKENTNYYYRWICHDTSVPAWLEEKFN